MKPTDEQRRAFGGRLRAARTEAGWTTIQGFADHLRDERLVKSPSVAKISAWERGEYAPKERATVEALEQALGMNGELVSLLGAELPSEPEIVALRRRVESVEGRLAALEAVASEPHLRAAKSGEASDPGPRPPRQTRSRPRPQDGRYE